MVKYGSIIANNSTGAYFKHGNNSMMTITIINSVDVLAQQP
jgi:hypothetical protein